MRMDLGVGGDKTLSSSLFASLVVTYPFPFVCLFLHCFNNLQAIYSLLGSDLAQRPPVANPASVGIVGLGLC